MTACAFCSLLKHPDRPLDVDEPLWAAFKPIGPVNEGHRLLVPRRHVVTFDRLDVVEAAALPNALSLLCIRRGIQSYNLGVNSGAVAGQTIFHLHIHVIPRVEGDVEDPRGGIITPLAERFEGSQFAEYLEGLAE